MKNLTIQARLTAWYFLSLAAIVALFAGGSWFVMNASMFHSIDRDLGYRMRTVIPFIQNHPLRSREQFDNSLTAASDSSVVGVFVQITDDHRQILYESGVLQTHRVPALPACQQSEPLVFTTIAGHGWPFGPQRSAPESKAHNLLCTSSSRCAT